MPRVTRAALIQASNDESSDSPLPKIKQAVGGNTESYDRAGTIFEKMSTSETFTEFLTLPLYEEV